MEDNKLIIDIIEEASEALDQIDESFSKKKEIDKSLNLIAGEVGKIRRIMTNFTNNLDKGIESLRLNRQKLDDILISFDADYITPIRNIIAANLPDQIKTLEDVRQYNIRCNEMYNENIEEKDTDNKLDDTIYLFENCFDNNKNKGLEYVCIGKIVIDNIDIKEENYKVKIYMNTKEKMVKNEYKEVEIPITNKLRIYNVITTLNTILYYGQ